MDKTIRLVVGAVIAFVFLGLYGWVLIDAIFQARGRGDGPNGEAWWLLQTIGALVSAVVAAELAVTKRGEAPAGRAFGFTAPGEAPTDPAKWTALAYLVVWLVLGLLAVILGMIEYRVEVPKLIDFAKTWVGLALGAAYAYFGIDP
jgi:hypothetical protein